jgi:hypothetical protein
VVSFIPAFPPKPYMHSACPHASYRPRPAHTLDMIILIIHREECKLWSSSLCSFLQPPITSPLFSPNIILSTLFSNTLSLCSSLNVRDQVLHPHKSANKIIVLYILNFTSASYINHISWRSFWKCYVIAASQTDSVPSRYVSCLRFVHEMAANPKELF